MPRLTGISLSVFILLCAPAAADPVVFHPEGCDFELTFPAAPTIVQNKATTDRGDSVAIDRASLSADLEGKPNYLRAECTHVPSMGFVDEDVLNNNMHDLGITYKLQSPITGIEHNRVAGAVGRLHARGTLGGKAMVIEVRRYTSKTSIFDLWIAAAPDDFPTAANTAFFKSLKLNGQDVP